MYRPLAVIFAFALIGAGCSESQDGGQTAAGSDAPVTWRFAIEEIQGSVQHKYAMKFAEILERKTDGAIKVEVYPYGTLGTSSQLTELVQTGAVEIAFASPGHLGSTIPAVQVFSIHYLFPEDMERVHQVLSESESTVPDLADAYAGNGLKLLSVIPEGWMVWTANKAIRQPADFQGVKIRTMVSPLLLKAYEAYGANPTPMAYSEVYSALQLNMIDAQVNPVFAIEEMGFYEQQSHMIFGYHLPFISTVIMNPGLFDSLSEEHRQALMEAESELDDFIYQTQARLNEKRLDIIKRAGGTEIIRLEPGQIQAFRALAQPLQREYVDLAGERGRKILEAIKAEIEESAGSSGEPSGATGKGADPGTGASEANDGKQAARAADEGSG